MKWRIFGTCLWVGAALTASPMAWAAPAAVCIPAELIPAKATTIPVNIPAFAYDALSTTSNDVTVLDGTTGTMAAATLGPVAGGWNKVVPSQPLIAGHSYEIDFNPYCSYGATPGGGKIKFTAAPEAPLPTLVGTITGTPTFTVKDYGTSEIAIHASYTLADEIKPWLAIYELALTIDGEILETKISPTGAVDAQGWCDAVTAKAGNTHQVMLVARLPFATTVESAPTQLEFSCPAPNIGTPAQEMLTPSPAATGGATDNPAAPSGAGTSKGCAFAPSSAPAFGSLGLALGVVTFLRRRLRRSDS